MYKKAERLLSLLCILALLPVPVFTGAIAENNEAPPQEISQWSMSQFHETITVTDTVFVMDQVIMSDGAELIVDGGRLVIAPDAVFYGDIVLSGEGSVFELEGTLHGNVRIATPVGHAFINGTLEGTLSLEGLSYPKETKIDLYVDIAEKGIVDTLVLAGVGNVNVNRGKVRMVDTDAANAAVFNAINARIGTLYARSNAQYNFFERAQADAIHMDCLSRSADDEGGLHNVALWEASHANEVVVDSGHIHASNGSSVDTLYLNGKGSIHLDQGYVDDGEASPTGYALEAASASKVIQRGRHTTCANNGRIGYHYVEYGHAVNGGYTETLVAIGAHIESKAGESIENSGLTVNLFSTFFDKHYGTIFSLGSSLHMNDETIIGKLFMGGGDMGDFRASVDTLVLDAADGSLHGSLMGDARIGTLVSTGKGNPGIHTDAIGQGVLPDGRVIGELPLQTGLDIPKTKATGGKTEEEPAPLSDGTYYVAATSGSQWFSMESDAYTAMEVSLHAQGGYGFAVVRTPDDGYHLMDVSQGPQTLSMLNEAPGAYSIRLIGAAGLEGFVLSVRTEAPLHIDYMLTERAAALPGQEPERVKGNLGDYAVTLYNETRREMLTDVTLGQGVLYAMPENASPGDALTLSLRKLDGSIQPYSEAISLDSRRYASVALEGTVRGRYVAEAADTYRAHLYLYDTDGDFLREVFPQAGRYDTGMLDAGDYHAVWIRASVGGWKMLRLSDFDENGLVREEHYLLDSFHINDGVIESAGAMDIPDEPSLQSQWLDADKTTYQSRVATVVEDGLSLLSLSWGLTAEQMQNAVAEITFLPGSEYVQGSASIDGVAVEAHWNDGTLRIPLPQAEGKLLFYVTGNGESDTLMSNAFITFDADDVAHTQYVGSAQTQIVSLSLYGPSLTPTRTITVYGYTSPYSVAYVYDNGMQAASAFSDGTGLWSTSITLSKEATHALTVGTGDEGVLSDPIQVQIAAGAPSLNNFTLYYIEHGISKEVDINGQLFGRSPVKFSYEPGTDLTFVLDVENDAYLDTVTVVAEMNGQRESLPTQRDSQSGKWIAVGQFTKDQMFAPDKFTVEFTIQDGMAGAVFQEMFATIPLIGTIYSVTDLSEGLMLTRHYMADPYAQTQDSGGFGPGWQTNYSLRATLYEAENSQWMAITSPQGMRIFAKGKRDYEEVSGYAVASVDGKGVVTVKEATGATMIFDKDGRLMVLTDAYRQKTSLVYDNADRLMEVNCGTQNLRFDYDSQGHIVSATNGNETASYYYTNGHLVTAVASDGSEGYTYDGLITKSGRHPLVCVNGLMGVLHIRYDDESRPIFVGLDDTEAEIAYYEDALVIRTDKGEAIYRLDAFGRCLRVEYADRYEEKLFTEEGILVRSVRGDGSVAELLYGPKGELLRSTDENGSITHMAYDNEGNLSSVIDANGNETKYGYDKSGNVTQIKHEDGTTERFTYDNANGVLTGYTDRVGNKSLFSFDRQGNLSRASYGDRSEVRYEYREDGELAALRSEGKDVLTHYLGDDGIVYEQDGRTIEMFWGDDHMSIKAGSDAYRTESRYQNGRLSQIMDGQSMELIRYTYDEDGQLIREDRGNGTYTTYRHENSNLLRMENYGADDTLHSFYAYTYDGLGNIVTQDTMSGQWAYAYDAIGQLVSSVSPEGTITEYAYDMAGNRLSETINGEKVLYESNAMNQYTQVGDASYTYDKNGQLIREESSGGAIDYLWDARGRLIAVDDGQTRTEYAYDIFGNRSGVTINGETTHYTMAPVDLPIMLLSDNGKEETYYHQGDNGLVASLRGDQLLYYSYTPLGSVSEITDADGNVLRRYEYDDMGRVIGEEAFTIKQLSQEGTQTDDDASLAEQPASAQALEQAARETASNPFTYVGRYGIMDDGNGLWYMRARYTRQDDFRFLSPDPSRQVYDVNLYRYAMNSPILLVDITGHKPTITMNTTGHEPIVSVTFTLGDVMGAMLSPIPGSSIANQIVGAGIDNALTQRYGRTPEMTITLGEAIGVFAPPGVGLVIESVVDQKLPSSRDLGSEIVDALAGGPLGLTAEKLGDLLIDWAVLEKRYQGDMEMERLWKEFWAQVEEYDALGMLDAEEIRARLVDEDAPWIQSSPTPTAAPTPDPMQDPGFTGYIFEKSDGPTLYHIYQYYEGKPVYVYQVNKTYDGGVGLVKQFRFYEKDGVREWGAYQGWVGNWKETYAYILSQMGISPDAYDPSEIPPTPTPNPTPAYTPEPDFIVQDEPTDLLKDLGFSDEEIADILGWFDEMDIVFDITSPLFDALLPSRSKGGSSVTIIYPSNEPSPSPSPEGSAQPPSIFDINAQREKLMQTLTEEGYSDDEIAYLLALYDALVAVGQDEIETSPTTSPMPTDEPVGIDIPDPDDEQTSLPTSTPMPMPTPLPTPMPTPTETDSEEENDNVYEMGSAPGDTTIDPSGYVYEGVHSNRVEGVTAVCYESVEGRPIQWAAEEYGQENPQTTDFLGQYAWYVPAGEWKVVYEKAGYEPLETGWLPVPPPQTEVNVGLVSYEAPAIHHAALYMDAAEVTFTKYMEPESVADAARLTRTDGTPIDYTIAPLNPEEAADGSGRLLASRFTLTTSITMPEVIVLTITEEALSYAGTPCETSEHTLQRTGRLQNLGLEEAIELKPYVTEDIAIQAIGEGPFDSLSLRAMLNASAPVSIEALQPFDASGKSTISLKAEGAGSATLSLYEETTGYTQTIVITIAAEAQEETGIGSPTKAIVNTRDDAGASMWDSPNKDTRLATVPKGQLVELSGQESEDGWLHVHYDGQEGYMEERYLIVENK